MCATMKSQHPPNSPVAETAAPYPGLPQNDAAGPDNRNTAIPMEKANHEIGMQA